MVTTRYRPRPIRRSGADVSDRVVAIVPARGGSKGIPNKNATELAGAPLLSWTLRQLRLAGIHEVVVSSDSRHLGEIAEDEGAIWLRRPGSLSGDSATSESALHHAVGEVQLGADDIVIFAQATSPLRLPAHVLDCRDELVEGGWDSVFSGVRIDDLCLWQGWPGPAPVNCHPTRRLRRQDATPHVVENGSLYAFRAGGLLSSGSRLHGRVGSSLMPKWTIHEVDEPEDLPICEALLTKFVLPELHLYDIRNGD